LAFSAPNQGTFGLPTIYAASCLASAHLGAFSKQFWRFRRKASTCIMCWDWRQAEMERNIDCFPSSVRHCPNLQSSPDMCLVSKSNSDVLMSFCGNIVKWIWNQMWNPWLLLRTDLPDKGKLPNNDWGAAWSNWWARVPNIVGSIPVTDHLVTLGKSLYFDWVRRKTKIPCTECPFSLRFGYERKNELNQDGCNEMRWHFLCKFQLGSVYVRN
jgi:hypothetical protein